MPIWIAKNGGQSGQQGPVFPAFFASGHYLKQFLPKYANKDELDQMARDRKLQSWVDLWGKGGRMDGPIGSLMLNADLPVASTWIPDKTLPTDPIRFVRNPYFWQVDEQGNQLPYIDAVESSLYENAEVFKLWLAQGKIDCQMRNLDAGAYTKHDTAGGGRRALAGEWHRPGSRASRQGCVLVTVGGDPPGVRQSLAARVLGWPATAHRHCACARTAAPAGGLRRAGLCAGRVDPGADLEPAAGPPG